MESSTSYLFFALFLLIFSWYLVTRSHTNFLKVVEIYSCISFTGVTWESKLYMRTFVLRIQSS